MKYLRFFIVFLAFMVFFLPSCDTNRIYEENIEIPEGIWNEGYIPEFKVNITDIKIPYNLLVNVRHGDGYPHKNLWLFIQTTSPSGKSFVDTTNFTLAEENGEWRGDGAGDLWDIQLPYKDTVGFLEPGIYTVKIRQGMRYDNLPYILSMGLRVEKAERK